MHGAPPKLSDEMMSRRNAASQRDNYLQTTNSMLVTLVSLTMRSSERGTIFCGLISARPRANTPPFCECGLRRNRDICSCFARSLTGDASIRL
jgi:hypothetical protein